MKFVKRTFTPKRDAFFFFPISPYLQVENQDSCIQTVVLLCNLRSSSKVPTGLWDSDDLYDLSFFFFFF